MIRRIIFVVALAGAAVSQTGVAPTNEERLARHRNLGKAFYENPTTQNESVEQFRQALGLAPGSNRERLNYGLALLRAGKTAEGVAELEAVQKREPSLPHTWFNLAIEWKKSGEHEKALAQIAKFVELVPNEPIGRYNHGALLKIAGRNAEALREFERAAELDHNLAAARFQLFNAYRAAGRAADAQRALAEFQALKKEQEGAAVPEDVDWCAYSEILDPPPPPLAPARPPVYADRVVATDATGVSIVDGRIVAWRGEPLAPADYDNDGVSEIAVVKADRVELTKAGKTVHTFPGVYRAAVWLDYDHDYDLDLFLLGRESKLYRNQGKAGFVERTVDFPFERGEVTEARVHRTVPDTRGLDLYLRYSDRVVLYRDLLGGKYRAEAAKSMPAAPALAADFDLDGREDLVTFDAGRVVQRMNRTVPRTNWIRVKLLGVRNLKRAMYAEVEVKAGRLYEKKVYYGEPLAFDLRNMAKADTVRITWPNGLIQNETNQVANRAYEYKEAQRLSGSCPIIWTWDGAGFRYITDVLGVAPLGAAAGDGKYFDTDHDEYIFIPGDALRAGKTARDGKLSVRITEELSEVAYLDQVKLIAVDHPADVAIYHNDKWKSPPYPEHRLWGVRTRIPAKADRDPYEFRREMNGIAEEHALTLRFPIEAPESGALVLRGWVDWADGSTFLAASQEDPKGLIPPRLEARDARGNWIVLDADMGMPAGKPKSIVVPVRFPSKYRELRIVTNLCVYWDEIFLTPDTRTPEHVSNTAPLSRAALRFRGFSPSSIHPERKQPERFAYDGATPTSLWNPTPGRYTRYGAVDTLLAAADDRMVVMGSGDEIALEFDAASLPALREGWTRDYLLYVDGWAKDRDANTADGQATDPLPFHAMRGYPLTKEERHPLPDYDRVWNTRPALRLLRPLSQP